MKPLTVIFLCHCVLTAAAQDKNQFYALDANMNQTVLDSSKYILWIHEKDSAQWQWDYYYTWGPLAKSTTYADHDGTVLNGRFCLYNSFGNLDSTGIVDHGKKNGVFFKFRSLSNDSMVMVNRYEYRQDSLIGFSNLIAAGVKAGRTDTGRYLQPDYPGGDSAWKIYLSKNLQYPERALNKAIQGEVRICFLVETDGRIKDPFIEKSVEYSVDQESLKLIKNSGPWTPGQQNGIQADLYRIQPVRYTLEKQ